MEGSYWNGMVMNWLLIAFRTDSRVWFMSLLIQHHLNGKEKLLVFHSIASLPVGIRVGLWDYFSARICSTFISSCEHRSMGAFYISLGDGKNPLSFLASRATWIWNWLARFWGCFWMLLLSWGWEKSVHLKNRSEPVCSRIVYWKVFHYSANWPLSKV